MHAEHLCGKKTIRIYPEKADRADKECLNIFEETIYK